MMERSLNHADERCTKRKTGNHRDPERDRHLHDRPAQVLQMLEKRLGGFALRRIAKFENVSQCHRIESSARRERQKTASSERGANPKRVGVVNFSVRHHATKLRIIY